MIKTHVHIGLTEDGEPVAAFETITEAREAVEDDSSLTNRDIVDCWLDVPLKACNVDTANDHNDEDDPQPMTDGGHDQLAARLQHLTSDDSRPPAPWAKRCPRGHANVSYRHQIGVTVCRACGLRWEGRPIDARDVDGFPISEALVEEVRR